MGGDLKVEVQVRYWADTPFVDPADAGKETVAVAGPRGIPGSGSRVLGQAVICHSVISEAVTLSLNNTSVFTSAPHTLGRKPDFIDAYWEASGSGNFLWGYPRGTIIPQASSQGFVVWADEHEVGAGGARLNPKLSRRDNPSTSFQPRAWSSTWRLVVKVGYYAPQTVAVPTI